MARDETRSLFGEAEATAPDDAWSDAPLAERMRPRGAGGVRGAGPSGRRGPAGAEDHRGGGCPALADPLGRARNGQDDARPPAGPHGEVTVFGALRGRLGREGGPRGPRRARSARRRGGRTVLFIDEIHRFNKAQQDALLPAVEDGTITLIGATTENPSFEVNAALLSRCRVLVLHALTEEDIASILRRAIEDEVRGLASLRPWISEEDLGQLARTAAGDARVALSTLESAVMATAPDSQGVRHLTWPVLAESLGRARYAFDKQGEDYFNLISAFIKSLRNSDANAAVYWLARMIEGGADPMFIARRLCILASEDVGLADPQAMVQAASAAQITHLIGLPEALFPLTQATIYLARAPKSNLVKVAYGGAAADAADSAREPVPMHLRNAVTPLMKGVGYGKGYRYAHDDPAASEEMPCLPNRFVARDYLAEMNPDATRRSDDEPPDKVI